MPEQEGYEVIRFVQHGSECQPVMDYARGEIFVKWLRSHPVVRKEEMFYMMRELIKQLIWLHQSEDESSYPYVTPYSVFLSETKEVLLLDFGAKSNEGIERQMKRRAIRNNFFPKMQSVRAETGVKSEIYSLGRTLQFLLTVQEPEPPIHKIEELRLRRIISRCLGKSRERPYEHIEDILKQFPKYKKINPQFPQILKKFTISSGVLFLVLASGAVLALKQIVPAMQQTKKSVDVQAAEAKKNRKVSEMNIQETSVSGDTKYGALCVDMGLTCFAELKDYERSREYFAQAGEAKLSPVYCRLAQYMGKQDIKDEELLRLLSDAGAGIEDCTDVRFVQSLLQVYGKMEEVKGRLSQDQYMTMALLGEKGKHMDEWKEKDPNHEKEKELCMYQVKGYEGSGELEKAEQPCFEWLELETDQGKREEICLKLSKIYESEGKMEEAREACASEIQKNETSKKLRILFIRLQCQDPGIERTVCASTIKEFLDQIPELAEEGEFLEIQEEYGIKIETDNVSFEV